MPKFIPDAARDAYLDFIDLADVQHVCSTLDSNPSYAEIVAASLAEVPMTPNTDFTKAAGDVSGRKVTVAAKSGVEVLVSGDANHLALVTVSGSVVRAVTTCTQQTVVDGNTVNIPAYDIELPAAT